MSSHEYVHKFIVCGLLLLSVFACQSGQKNVDNDKPNAVHDLLIDRISWKTSPASQAGDTPINLHRFTISNTSPRYSYSQIEVRFDYYDRDHHKIDSSRQTVKRTLEPRAAIAIGELRAGSTKSATTSATVTVVTAVGSELPH
ncbi:hypothetical protein [Spirosoma flavum]|uniref:DUF1425 domain-containing protein n=1 Tax=Spirosoma flavum TaxID=2048557 RepID=A0ABW6AED4_9BACT